MRTISQMGTKLIEDLATKTETSCSTHTKTSSDKRKKTEIYWIYSSSGGVKLDNFIFEEDAICPDCGGNNGFVNPGWHAWSCLNHDNYLHYRCHKIAAAYPEPELRFDKKDCESRKLPSLSTFNVPFAFSKASLEDCSQDQERKDLFTSYALDPQGFLLFAGRAGVGKTYSACAILDEYRKRDRTNAKFINVSDLYIDWRRCFIEDKNELRLLDSCKDLELLVLDDLGQRTPSDAFMEFLYIIINTRESSGDATIFTTNLNREQMQARYGEALTSRICSGQILKFEGIDKRLKF